MTISLPVLILLGALVLAGSVVQGTIGFGLGTMATPIIAMFAPQLVPMLVLTLALFISTTTTIQNARHVDWKFFAQCTVFRIPGTLAGAWAVATLSHSGLSLFIGCAVLLAMTLSSLGWTPRDTLLNRAIAAVASGLFGTSTSVGGPPLALMVKDRAPAVARGTLSATFITGCIISMLTLTLAGQVHREVWLVVLLYLPLVVIGLVIATKISRNINKAMLNRIIAVVSISAASILIIKSLLELF